MKKTKIVATIGPASAHKPILAEMITNGLNVMRVNFSHGDSSEHIDKIEMLNELNDEMKTFVGWMADLKGPEIRTHKFKNGKAQITKNSTVNIYTHEVTGDEFGFSVTYEKLTNCVKVGGQILVDDGLIAFEVKAIEDDRVVCTALNSGVLSDRKGVNIPNAILEMDFVSVKDANDIKFACENGASYIAASFTRRASDVLEIRELCKKFNRLDMCIISKIENQEGVDNIEEIIEVSDGIMVARGDLGTEVPLENVPLIQKELVEACNVAGKPVIVATQMLDSMERNPRPTRAEVSDVANAVLDGTDAVMLSGESAKGDYPIQALNVMARIATQTETILKYNEVIKKRIDQTVTSNYDPIGIATAEIALKSNAKYIFVFTETGSTASKVAKYRPVCPIIAISRSEMVLKSLSVTNGIIPNLIHKETSLEDKFEYATKVAIESGVQPGESIIVTGGHPDGTKETNFMKIIKI